METETRLSIVGMTCEHCQHAVEEALKSVSGVERVAVDLESATARVWGGAQRKALVDAISEAGYTATG